jgi:hypothetical protein
MPAATVIEHLVGIQAQEPHDPYVALWSRIDAFRPEELSDLIATRKAVRAPLLRATIHLVTARDALTLRPLLQPVLERCLFSQSPFGRRLWDVDLDDLVGAGRALVEERPRSRAELRPLLSKRWPGCDVDSLVYGVTYLLPLVQVPPRGLSKGRGRATWATVETWLGEELDPSPSPERTLLRYLGAFGPATVTDARVWSGLTRLREIFERIRSELVTFRDDRGRELFDLPDAPRPDPEMPAPGSGGMLGTILVDGFAAAFWRIVRSRDGAAMTVLSREPLPAREEAAVEEEGLRLLQLVTAGADPGRITFHTAG